MARPRSGRLRHRIDVQAKATPGATADDYGGQENQWTTVIAGVPAECDNVSGSEEFTAQQVHGHAQWTVLLRFHPNINDRQRFAFTDRTGTHYLYPVSVVSDVKNIWIDCLCTEHLSDGKV
jgi:SPP1 family predicted phage head-tail adaptor